jgi:hypothetical protein
MAIVLTTAAGLQKSPALSFSASMRVKRKLTSSCTLPSLYAVSLGRISIA